MDSREQAVQRELMAAWEKANENRKRQREREDARRWAPIGAPLTLAQGLARLTKAELSAVRSRWALSGMSSLNKQELADKLAESLPPLLESRVVAYFDDGRYELLRRAAGRQDGVIAPPADEYKALYFASLGLLFPGTREGKRVLVMPQELARAFRGLGPAAAEKASVNAKLLKLAKGCLFYYGVLDLPALTELLQPHVKEKLRPAELAAFLDEALDYEGGGMQTGEFGYADEGVIDPEQVRAEHRARPELPFKPFATEQLLAAGDEDFVDRTAAYRDMVAFLTETYDIAREEADDLVRDCSFEIQNGQSPSLIVEFFQEQFDMSDAQVANAFVGRIMKLMNGTRLWALKGHAPNELSAAAAGGRGEAAAAGPAGRTGSSGSVIDFATGRKIGRNDPCPCGSGKKFKKCCGG